MNPPITPTYTTIFIRMSNMLIKTVGSSVIFFLQLNYRTKFSETNKNRTKKMADEKFNIEVAVNAQLESLNKIQNAIGDLNQKLNGLSEGASDVNKVWSGAMYNIGAKMSDLALKFPSFATAAIQAFGQQEAAVQKLAAAIRSQGGERVRSSAYNVSDCIGNAAHNNLRRRTSSFNAVYGDGNGSFGGSKEPVHSRRHRLD